MRRREGLSLQASVYHHLRPGLPSLFVARVQRTHRTLLRRWVQSAPTALHPLLLPAPRTLLPRRVLRAPPTVLPRRVLPAPPTAMDRRVLPSWASLLPREVLPALPTALPRLMLPAPANLLPRSVVLGTPLLWETQHLCPVTWRPLMRWTGMTSTSPQRKTSAKCGHRLMVRAFAAAPASHASEGGAAA